MSEQALQIIGQGLHDNIGQILYAAFLQASALSEKLRASSLNGCDALDNIKGLPKQSIKDTRKDELSCFANSLLQHQERRPHSCHFNEQKRQAPA